MKLCAKYLLAGLLCLLTACAIQGPKGGTSPADDPLTRAYFTALEPMREQNWKKAERALLKFAEQHPKYAGPWVNLAIVYRQLGRNDAAAQAVTKALSLNPGNAAAWNQRGIMQREAGQLKEAEAAYRKALEINPEYPLAWLNMGILYDLYFQRHHEALTFYLRYEELMNGEVDRQAAGWIADLKRRVGRQ